MRKATNFLFIYSISCFFPICEDKQWHVHVVNIVAARVEILSFIPLKRQNKISVMSRRLSLSISRAMHAYGL